MQLEVLPHRFHFIFLPPAYGGLSPRALRCRAGPCQKQVGKKISCIASPQARRERMVRRGWRATTTWEKHPRGDPGCTPARSPAGRGSTGWLCISASRLSPCHLRQVSVCRRLFGPVAAVEGEQAAAGRVLLGAVWWVASAETSFAWHRESNGQTWLSLALVQSGCRRRRPTDTGKGDSNPKSFI